MLYPSIILILTAIIIVICNTAYQTASPNILTLCSFRRIFWISTRNLQIDGLSHRYANIFWLNGEYLNLKRLINFN